MVVLWVPADGSITFRYILLWHQINGGLWRTLYLATFIIIGAHTVLDLGTITFTHWGACIMGAPIFTLVVFGGTGNFSSGMTLLLHNINLFHQFFAPCRVDTIYGLGVVSSGIGITIAGWHRLTWGAFCSHTGYWGRSGGTPLAWASQPAYSCPLESLLHFYMGLWSLLGGLFQSAVSHHQRWSLPHHHTLKQQTQGQRSHSYNNCILDIFK